MTFKEELKEKIYKLLPFKSRSNQSEVYCKNSTTKYSMNSSCSAKFSVDTEKKKQEINDKLKAVVQKYMNHPEKLIQYIRLSGANVYKIDKAELYLSKLGEEEGFLTPLKGKKAFIINLLIGIFCEKRLKIGFSTKEMFIFNKGCTEIYTIARAMHKYYGFKYNLPGFDYKSQEIFKKVYESRKKGQGELNFITIHQMYDCKEAIARDLESINFTVQLSIEYERAKKALKKLQDTNSANI